MKNIIGVLLLWTVIASRLAEAQAQLAITEVMAQSSTNLWPSFQGPDFWELTNFGTNDIPLRGYGFSDNDNANVFTYPFTNVVIRAGESVIFCRSNSFPSPGATVEEFKAWWGSENLPTGLQVLFYFRPGFDGQVGDEIWFRDPSGKVVDRVTFDESVDGRSFGYHEQTGVFGQPSTSGVSRAFRAVSATNDVGSPGVVTGPVALSIAQQPASQIVYTCDHATFEVVARGMPPPRFQWNSNGIPIPGANGPVLNVRDVTLSSAAEYQAVLNNGLMELASAPAVLTVNTNPLAPVVIAPPVDSIVFPGQAAVFAVEARAVPCAEYEWRVDGLVVPGQTTRVLTLAVPPGAPESTAIISVRVRNALGSTNLAAQLRVERRPCLSITEVMSSPTNAAMLGHGGWFELTNCDTNEVNLQGFFFRDSTNFAVGASIYEAIVIKPGESVVFVEALTRAQFMRWWGEDALPPNLQVITWGSWGLSDRGTDIIHVWNRFPADALDTVATASHLPAINGVSQELSNYCDEFYGCTGQYLRESIMNENGAFRAAEGGDIGSPGYTSNPSHRLLGVARDESGSRLKCRVQAGATYRLVFKDRLTDPAWTPLVEQLATNAVIELKDPSAGPALTRFYRLEALP